MKKILHLVVILLFISGFLFIAQKSWAYQECETPTWHNGCNPNGSKAGEVMEVTPNGNGTYQCDPQGVQAWCVQSFCPGVNPYPECESGNQTACNPDGSKTGHNFSVYACNNTWYCVPNDIPGCGLPQTTTTYNCTNNACVTVNDSTGTYKDQSSCQAACPAAVTKKYKCSNNACVEDDTNGTFTDSSCQNTCAPAAAPHTTINLALSLLGIGSTGNLNPKHKTRVIHVQVYKKGDDPAQPNVSPVAEVNNTLTYDSNSGYFSNSALDLGTNIPAGDYQILIKVPRYLRKEIATKDGINTFTLTPGSTTILPTVQLISGDVAPLYNSIGPDDFYAIADCYNGKDDDGATSPPTNCAAGTKITDLNDDGVIDGIDLNIWLLGYQAAQASPNGASGGVEIPGDGVTGE